ncbi:hypothetical protein ABTJ52_19815, partial [Acinetobacter baumannii]
VKGCGAGHPGKVAGITHARREGLPDVPDSALSSPPSASTKSEPLAEPPAATHGTPAVALAAVGASTVVEWYDFTLGLYFAPTLARVFFGAGSQ